MDSIENSSHGYDHILSSASFETNTPETFLLPTDAHNVKKHRVIKTF